jgi:2-keto-4-pentenoate hydratase/2-oxohepta-3-ene-1,7-dioic acid hydratase in catechol pathway
MLAFIENGPVALEAAGQALDHVGTPGYPMEIGGEKAVHRAGDVRLRAPIPRPVSLRDTLNFEVHLKNAMKALNRAVPKLWYELPTFYRTTHTNVAGPEDPILWPSYTEQLDYELEFACCIGKEGKSIPRDSVSDYIFGYTIFNDISARDILAKEMGLGVGPAKGKNFENANIMGPCLVTADEIDADNVRMVARINGEVWSEGNSKDMHFKFAELIEYLSKDEPIYPGEFIASGTVGFGCCMELGKWIKPGDVVELEVKGIGVLRNTVVGKT